MSDNSNLEFRKIKSLLFLYEVNENGSILRNVKSKRQIQIRLDKHHNEYGYYAAFVNIKGKVKRVMMHKVVAECWLGDRPPKMQIDHIDRNAHNNHYSNLRYVTHSENMKNRKLSDRIIKQATQNCYEYTMKYVAKPVKIMYGTDVKTFSSMIECSKYMASLYDVKSESIRSKLKKRRSHIYDYDIVYLNAETGRANSTE
jgi:hypothetical protein